MQRYTYDRPDVLSKYQQSLSSFAKFTHVEGSNYITNVKKSLKISEHYKFGYFRTEIPIIVYNL